MDETQRQSNTKKLPLIPIAVGIVILVIIAVFFLFKPKVNAPSKRDLTLPVTSTTDETKPVSDPSNENSQGVIEVIGKSFSFSPSEIKVKQGQKVVIRFTNIEGYHDFVIDEFKVKTSKISAPSTEEIEFKASKKGTFEYYCSVGNHRAQGMKGKLIVE